MNPNRLPLILDHRGAAASIARQQVYRHQGFSNQGKSLRGEPGRITHSGWANRMWADSMREADYAIYSYQTPIAWHRPDMDCWVMPNVGYSVTTTRHQGVVRRILQGWDVQ